MRDYVCLRKGRWKRGLFLLAQSDDSNLRSLAQRDLARPDAHKDQIMLGNEWWTLADKRDGLVKTRLRQRATYWYQEALEKAEGELRKTLEKRIAMVPPIPGAVPPWDYFGKPGRIWQSVNSRTVYSVAFSPDGKYVTSGCSGDDVVFWDAKTGKETKRFRGHTSTIRAETFSPDGRHVYSASSDSTIRKWDVKTGRQVMQLPKQGRFGSFYGVDVSPDGRRVLGGCSNRTVMLFDAQTGKKLKTLSGHRGTVYAVKFFDKGRKAVSGSSGNRLIIWDLTTGRQIRTISARSSVRSIAVTPDNRYVIASEYSTTVRMWDIRTGQMVRQFAGNIGSVYSVAIAPDGKRLATAASGGRIGYWDLRTGRLLQTFQGHTGTIYHIAFSPGGGRLVSGSTGRQVCVWGLPRNP
ncbi:MAG: WD40 repeat domain-containing protein [Gemmataceae bacterium]